jgi:pimeloyl-ACP methyl ester carboxylesterase
MKGVRDRLDLQNHRSRKGKGCLGCIGQVLIGLVLLVVLLALVGAIYQIVATRSDERRYPPPGELVDVGGYRLHIHCIGEGSPTVVLDAGLPGTSLDWCLVQPAIAQFTQVCAYDRAGYGWSDPGPLPRTSQQIATELHTLLAGAGVQGPYVLVGHSFGGYNVRLYAHSFADDVAGIVLVDAAHENQTSRWPPEVQRSEATRLQVNAVLRTVAQVGLVRLVSELGLDPLLKERLMQLPADVQPMWKAVAYRTGYLSTAYAELSVFEESAAQVSAAGSLGDMRLVVMTSGTLDSPMALPGYPVDQMNRIHRELQNELTGLSTNSTHIVAEASEHYIQLDQPALLVNVIRQMVEMIRGQ